MGLHLSSEGIPGPRAEQELQVQALQQKCKGSQTRCLAWGVRSGEKEAGAGVKGGLLLKLPFPLVHYRYMFPLKMAKYRYAKRERERMKKGN